MLLFKIRPQSQEIVDFLRNFTVEVVGVGDVCSFAQMDVKRHGSPTWRADDHVGDSDSFGSDPSSDKEMSDFAKNAGVRAPNKVQVSGRVFFLYSSDAFFLTHSLKKCFSVKAQCCSQVRLKPMSLISHC